MPTIYFDQLCGSRLLEKAFQQNIRGLAVIVFGAKLRTSGKAAYYAIAEVQSREDN